MQAQPLVLIVEDDPDIADVLEAYLRRDGFECLTAVDGRTALQLHAIHKPDMVVLDVMLPQLNGLEVLAELRRRGSTPVLMASAVGEDLDKLVALRSGADDYIVKPYNAMEVVARVQAVLRRTRAPAAQSKPVLRLGRLTIDMEAVTARVDNGAGAQLLELTPAEFRLLSSLAQTPNRAFTRQELLERCMPESDALERVMDTHVRNLRRKLEEAGLEGIPVAVRGVGYRFGPPA